jgi:hypothetical protein
VEPIDHGSRLLGKLIFGEEAKLVGYPSKLQDKRSDTKVFRAMPRRFIMSLLRHNGSSLNAICDFREFLSGRMINRASATFG